MALEQRDQAGLSPSESIEMETSKDPTTGYIEDIHQVRTVERVPGHNNYYEKDGLRTYGDSQDHDHEPPMTFKRYMALIAMAFLWTGSQIPVYLFGGVLPYIYGDLGNVERYAWIVVANLLALAGVCPFVGSLSDLIGRRWVAIIGAVFLVVGMIICSTVHSMNNFIAGMTLAGAGAGICELTALAATSELAPTRKRGTYVAVLVFTIVPFCPSVLWGQLIAYHSTWRYIGLLCAVWNFIGLAMTAIFYFPPPRVNSSGLTRRETIAQIDFVGGLLSISGMVLFMMGMLWGGYQYAWTSTHVLVTFFLGLALLVAFVLWEMYGAKYPMFPKRLRQEPRVLILTLIITAISGANFFSILMFWPTQAFNVYGHDPVGVGVRGLPGGFAILAGACIVLVLLSVLKGHNRALLIVSSVLMTAGIGGLAAANRYNLAAMWIVLIIAGLGIGGIVVPASIITTIICPDDLIATVVALTLAIRVIGGVIGYTIYYNVFVSKFVPILTKYVGGVMLLQLHITDPAVIRQAIVLTGESLIHEIHELPGIKGNEAAYQAVVLAGQLAYAEAYKYVYLVSIAFGALSIIAACCLGDIRKYMDDHVAVVIA